jgi:hypothetical protein
MGACAYARRRISACPGTQAVYAFATLDTEYEVAGAAAAAAAAPVHCRRTHGRLRVNAPPNFGLSTGSSCTRHTRYGVWRCGRCPGSNVLSARASQPVRWGERPRRRRGDLRRRRRRREPRGPVCGWRGASHVDGRYLQVRRVARLEPDKSLGVHRSRSCEVFFARGDMQMPGYIPTAQRFAPRFTS